MKVKLINTQSMLGDRLMFTPVVRDLKAAHPDWEIAVESIGPEIWYNNPHISHNMTKPDKSFKIGPGKVTHGSKTNGLHITDAFRISLQENLGEQIKQGPYKPEIFLSEEEKNNKLIDGNYWVINTDTGPFSAKRWYNQRFQAVVERLYDITFVQVGLQADNDYRLKGPNVIDLIGKTKIRELFSLVYNADGCISLVSSLMHVAAAFDKPCVVLAGGREPSTFERYQNHRFIDQIGCLPCCSKLACWKNSITACKNKVQVTKNEFNEREEIARCMDMINVQNVVYAVNSYYEGGVLQRPERIEIAKKKPLIRIITNAKCLGGAERSVIEITKLFADNKWRVEISTAGTMCEEFRQAMPAGTIVSNHVTRECDIFLLYASDMVFNFNQPQFAVFTNIKARRKVMALTYKIGKAGQVDWTKGWDKYLFLSSDLRDGFLKKVSNAETEVLAPAVDIEPFLRIQPDYNQSLRIVRHSSQGDKKFPADIIDICRKSPAHFFFMPAASWMGIERNISISPYQSNIEKVAEFLSKGNLFWYLLPEGYTDQGPRVIVEAMAAGLPVIAENKDGAKDRVTTETGWLIDSHEEVIDLLHSIDYETLKRKGKAAKERAENMFVANKWYELISGGINYGDVNTK
jgi:ADP-heptose:LPS heptosyltransferase/glycosyltransferase involved in cell wall biosynthesis